MKTPPTKVVITISIVIILFVVIASITIPVAFIYFVQKENSTETGMSLNIILTSYLLIKTDKQQLLCKISIKLILIIQNVIIILNE